MWICIRCHTEFPDFAGGAEANIDSFGFYFMCPVCGRRNRLRNIGGRGDNDPIVLEQIDDPE